MRSELLKATITAYLLTTLNSAELVGNLPPAWGVATIVVCTLGVSMPPLHLHVITEQLSQVHILLVNPLPMRSRVTVVCLSVCLSV